MSDTPSPIDVDRDDDGLPRVVEADASAEVRDVLHTEVRVRWTVTIECECGETVEASSFTPIVKCEECKAEWEAKSALS